jgi:methyltransferase (TIGR00027 family)
MQQPSTSERGALAGAWYRRSRARLEQDAAARAAGRSEWHPEQRHPDRFARLMAGPLLRLLLLPPVRAVSERWYEAAFPGLYSFQIARAKRFDELFALELARGLGQIVLLGIGCDSRSHRFAEQIGQIPVFEVDHSSTLAWKRRRLARVRRAGIALREVALESADQSLDAALQAHGYRPELETLFVCEGMAPHLSRQQLDAVLSLVSRAAPGSSILFDYMADSTAPGFTNGRAVSSGAEPHRFVLEPEALAPLLSAHGLSLVENTPASELRARYFGDAPRRFGPSILAQAALAHARVGGAAREASARKPAGSADACEVESAERKLPVRDGSVPWLNTFRSVWDPFREYERLRRLYPDPVWVPMAAGTILVTGEPEGARDVFTADPDSFEVYAADTVGTVFGPQSVLMLTGEQHRRERKLLNPRFHGARMRAYARTMQQVAVERAGDWQTGRPFEMLTTTKMISREIIIRVIFGVVTPERLAEFQRVLQDYERAGRPELIFFKFMRQSLGGLGPWDHYQAVIRELDRLIYRELAERRSESGDGIDDILGLLLSAQYEDGQKMSDSAIRDELIALTLAGYATSAIAIAWAIYWLHVHPAKLHRLREELATAPDDGPEQLANLPYLEAVCHETLRLYPLVSDVFRRVRKPLRVRGQLVPVGYGICVATPSLHYREETFPNPTAFIPERFLERKYSAHEYAPFGGGARRCLGAAFALYEMKIVLGTILRSYDFELLGPERPVRMGLLMGPKTGVRVRVVRRRAP